MEEHYGSINANDYDVVRSTQFSEDFARGVSHLCIHVLDMQMSSRRPSANMKDSACMTARYQTSAITQLFASVTKKISCLYVQVFKGGNAPQQRFDQAQVHPNLCIGFKHLII